LGETVVMHPEEGHLEEIYSLKRELLYLRRAIWPLREALSALEREPAIQEETKLFVRDCYDHAIQIIDILEGLRERGASLMDIYMSSISNKMNEVMKVLTLFATIFMPLGFIAGLYGMNFNTETSPYNLPELNWYYGYPIALGTMFGIALALLIFFYCKGWLGKK